MAEAVWYHKKKKGMLDLEWIGDAAARVKRKNQILFTKDCELLAPLRLLLDGANRRAVVMWALSLAQETADVLTEKYPERSEPQRAVDDARRWAAGQIKMPVAKASILALHAMAKTLADPADRARCHAAAQACSTVHTPGHALGYPVYELTALVCELGLKTCCGAVEARAAEYAARLLDAIACEPAYPGPWACFLFAETERVEQNRCIP